MRAGFLTEYVKFKPEDLYQLGWWESHNWRFWNWGRVYYMYSPKEPTAYQWGNIWIPLRPGEYDGATWAIDRVPENDNPPAWLTHDNVCNHPYGFDSSGNRVEMTAEMAAQMLYDCLKENGHPKTAPVWKWATYRFGCRRARKV